MCELRVAFRNYALLLFRVIRKSEEEGREDIIKAVKAWCSTRIIIDPEEIRKIIADAIKQLS